MMEYFFATKYLEYLKTLGHQNQILKNTKGFTRNHQVTFCLNKSSLIDENLLKNRNTENVTKENSSNLSTEKV